MENSGASRSVKIAAFLFSAALFVAAVAALDMTVSKLVPTGVNESDAKLGWRLKRNVTYRREKSTFAGRKYDVVLSTDEHGVRTYGANRNAPIRILVLGDSFTGEPYASNEQMWYAALVRRLAELTGRPLDDFHVVAAASGGYGTLQTLLLSQEVKQFYTPTLLIHQFCDNDFANNSFEQEQKSVVLNQWMQRPYLAKDRETIVWHEGTLARLYRAMLYRSALFGVFDRALQVSLSNHYGGYLMIKEKDKDAYAKEVRAATYDPEAIDVTRFLLMKLRKTFADTPAVMFDCPIEPSSLNAIWVDAARSAGFIPIVAPSDDLLAAKARGEFDLFATDGAHLSDTGNEVMGRVLAQEIMSLGLIQGK
jgi:lysophospholipase L1-like esterase